MSHDTSGDIADLASSPLDGRYRILSRLGSGGMADVYLARDESLGRLVAIKVLKERLAADAEFVERFRIEAQAAASLNHPAIVAVYDRGRAGASPYIAMEYVDGESLKQRLRRKGRLSPDEAAATALAVLDALQEAHARHIVHRDVTSANVLVDEAGPRQGRGFRHRAHGRLGAHAHRGDAGHVLVPSPEQAQGRSRRRALRPLQPRRGALRDAHRTPALHRRERPGRGHAACVGRPAQPALAGARTCPKRTRPS